MSHDHKIEEERKGMKNKHERKYLEGGEKKKIEIHEKEELP